MANSEKLDPMVKKVDQLAKIHGFYVWIKLNFYLKRDTIFEALPNFENSNWHRKNLAHICSQIRQVGTPNIVVAFGGLILDRN